MEERKRRKRVMMHPARRRETILRAAADVMARKGAARTAISDITTAADIAKGTFYLYFESKNHLLSAMWASYVDELIAQAAALLQETKPKGWLAVTDTLIEQLVRFDLEHADLRRMIYEGAGPDALRMFTEGSFRLLELLREMVRQGVADGGFHTAHPEMIADLIYHASYGVLRDRILYGPPLDVDLFIVAVKDMVYRCLAPRPAAVSDVAVAVPAAGALDRVDEARPEHQPS
jgi:AcrR family transcriptional regulator